VFDSPFRGKSREVRVREGYRAAGWRCARVPFAREFCAWEVFAREFCVADGREEAFKQGSSDEFTGPRRADGAVLRRPRGWQIALKVIMRTTRHAVVVISIDRRHSALRVHLRLTPLH